MPPDPVSEGTVVGVVLSPPYPPSLDGGGCAIPGEDVGSVSYTHLTLPTILLV